MPGSLPKQDPVDWAGCDTVLLDMDGTILDLAYDNYFWRELVPRCLARMRGGNHARVSEELFDLYAGKQGTLDWYCLDYWSETLGLDLRALKAASSHRIRYLPGAREFLIALTGTGKRVVLVTNAHGITLEIKRGVTGLDRYLQHFVSAHEFGHPKEQPDFWLEFRQRLDFDPGTAIFVDDSLPVLDAAAAFGIRQLFAVRRPDTRKPPAQCEGYRAVDGVTELLAGLRVQP